MLKVNMAGFPSPTQVAGNHTALYEALYQQEIDNDILNVETCLSNIVYREKSVYLIDPAGTGCISAMEAAAFLKRSSLSDAILSKIWDLSDPNGNGFLDKRGFFVALKLIALAQSGKEISMTNISLQVPPPQMGDLSRRASAAIDWAIKPTEQIKYEEMFNSLGPIDNKLPGTKVKPVMLNSKLPLETLGKIWDLSDIDQDGYLDKDEFILAMHLVYKALENVPVPCVLPPELFPSKRKKSIVGGVQVLPDLLPGMDGAITGTNRRSSTPTIDVAIKNAMNKPAAPWVVTATDKAKYDEIFHTLDKDHDGFVTGVDVKDVLLQSGLPQTVLAHLWNLCDVKQNGKLNTEQFALSMYLVNKKLQGGEIPSNLTPEMIPPTLRPKPGTETTNDSSAPVGTTDNISTGNKEIDLISSEIKELQKEKMTLEQDIAQKEADLKIKNGELKNLQNEQEALTAMLRQLEIQKGEAQKRLDDLDIQKNSLLENLSEMKQKIEEESIQIDNMKKQLEEQECTLQDQETELNSKRQELNDLRQEETKLEQQITSSRNSLDSYSKSLQDTQIQINQTRFKITQLEEQHQQMTDALQLYQTAIKTGDFTNVNDSLTVLCTITPPLSEPEYQRLSNTAGSSPVSSVGAFSADGIDEFKEDPFKSKDPFISMNGFTTDPFGGEDPFKSDPFKSEEEPINSTVDPFGADPFKDAFGGPVAVDDKDDPFKGSDPFSSFSITSGTSATNDPFNSFGNPTDSNVTTNNNKPTDSADPFGADPFSPVPVAPPRPESPTPALPPKKGKAPPPRPAPPKHASSSVKTGPTRAAPAPPPPPSHDPFINTTATTTSTTAPFLAFGAGDQTVQVSQSSASSFQDPFGSLGEADTIGPSAQDPFDPFGIKAEQDPFASSDGTGTSESFANFADFEKFVPPPKPVRGIPLHPMSEDEQLAWAAEESLQLEWNRQRLEAEREQADLELALALSRAEVQNK